MYIPYILSERDNWTVGRLTALLGPLCYILANRSKKKGGIRPRGTKKKQELSQSYLRLLSRRKSLSYIYLIIKVIGLYRHFRF
jgi:hypothetical protein